MRATLMAGRLTPLKAIHLSRILGKTVSFADDEVIAAATRLSVRELESLARKKAAGEAESGSEASEVPNPWEEKKNLLEFSGSPRVFYLFRAAIEAARRFAGEELQQACLEYIAADRLSAVGAPPDLDRPVKEPVPDAKAPENPEAAMNPAVPPGPEVVEGDEEIEIPVELNANLARSPQVQWLEARNRGLRIRVGKLPADFQLIDGYRVLGYATFNEYCRDELDLGLIAACASSRRSAPPAGLGGSATSRRSFSSRSSPGRRSGPVFGGRRGASSAR